MTIPTSDEWINGPSRDKEAIIRDLKDCLEEIVDRYIANRGDEDGEFISCITAKPADQMSALERQKDPTWSMFDRARILLGET